MDWAEPFPNYLGDATPTLMRRVGIADEYSDSAPNDALLLRHGLDPLSIVAVAREILAQKSS